MKMNKEKKKSKKITLNKKTKKENNKHRRESMGSKPLLTLRKYSSSCTWSAAW